MSSQPARQPSQLETETRSRLGKAQQIIRMLEDELDETNKGLIALTVELEERANQLQRAEEKYRGIFENAVEGIFRTTPDGRLLVANPALARIFGYDSAEQMCETITSVADDLYLDRERRDELERALGREEVVEGFELRARRRDGTAIWVEEHSRALRDPSGRLVGYEGTVQDITERKKTEDALRKSEERYRLMIEGSEQVFFYAHDTDGRFEYLSPSVENLLGYAPQELLGRHFSVLLTDDPANEQVHQGTRQALHGDGRTTYTAMTRHKDGHAVPMEVLESAIVRDGEAVGVQGFARDIRDRRRAEEALRSTQEQLQQAQKMEAIGRLAGGIAHDFNNVLNVIGGNAEMVLMDTPEDAAVREDLLEIKRASERAAELTRQLLTFSRQQVLRPRVMDLNEVISEMQKMLTRVISEDIELRVELAPERCAILADPGQMEQALLNLVVNAKDALDQGGRISIKTSVVDSGSGMLGQCPLPLRDGRYVHLVVRDTGSGIPEHIRERIFEPFFTTKEQGKGTGLGLASVYGMVTQSSGHIWVESTEGEGAAFHICLPYEGRAPEDRAESPNGDAMVPGDETILLVEDEEALRQLARKALTRAGYQVLVAEDGVDAIRIASHEEEIDLLVTDVVMPGMSGREVADAVGTLLPHVKVLYTSGYMDDAIVQHGVVEESVAFLPKPYSPSELTQAIRTVIDDDQVPRLNRR